MFTVILPFTLSLICYCIILYTTKITTSHISEPSLLPRRGAKLICLSIAISLIAGCALFFYLQPTLFPDTTSNVWSFFLLISLFSSLILLFYSYLLAKPNPLDSIRYPGQHYRQKSISSKVFIKLLSPLNSIRSVTILFLLLVILPYVSRGTILLLLGQKTLPSYHLESLFAKLTFSALGAPILEEIFFRWFTYKFFGVRGLVVGSILWLICHPVDRFQMGMNWVQIWPSIPFWVLDVFFYIKLWQGKYYWTSFLFHSLTNIMIISASTFLGIS
jgi:membrane protease YdiL (CAAX protease family)